MQCTRYSRQILMKLEIFRQISNFMEMRPVLADLYADGQE